MVLSIVLGIVLVKSLGSLLLGHWDSPGSGFEGGVGLVSLGLYFSSVIFLDIICPPYICPVNYHTSVVSN